MAKKVVKLKEKRQIKIAQVQARRRKRLFLTVFVIAVVIVGAWLLYNSNFFNVNEIKVQGNKNISDQYVIERSGIKRSDSLLSLPSAKIASRVKRINWVQHAAIIKNWPNAVTLDIIERKPIAFLKTDEDTFLVDKKAFVIVNLARLRTTQKLPKIDSVTVNKVKIGTYIKNEALDNALSAYRGLPKQLQARVTSIIAKSVDDLYFIAYGVEIIYGKAQKMKMKNLVIRTLLKHKKEEIAVIDLRIPSKPVIRTMGK